MARASAYTLLSLDRYAKVMGLSPLHFAGAQTPGLTPMIFPDKGCNSIWYQYDWQHSDQVSREQLADTIKSVEDEIISIVGFPLAPMWIEGEEIRPYSKNAVYGTSDTFYDVNGRPKSIIADNGKIISAGRRSLVVVGTATVAGGELVYSDEDGDGFYETATITLAIPTNMLALTDACEFKTFFDGETSLEWEVRYPRSSTITGGNIVIVFDSWLLIDPDLWEAYPNSDGAAAIDVSTIDNFVTTLDVYREYINTSAASVRFFWENASTTTCTSCDGSGCVACAYTTQDGCMIARDTELGVIVPFPATYDDDACVWYKTNYSVQRHPDMVRLWYIAGEQDKRYLNCRTCDPMTDFWARTVARMATARLERPICMCSNIIGITEYLRQDLSQFSRAEVTYFQTDDIINCPFGTLRGEVEAWRRIKKVLRGKNRKISVAVI